MEDLDLIEQEIEQMEAEMEQEAPKPLARRGLRVSQMVVKTELKTVRIVDHAGNYFDLTYAPGRITTDLIERFEELENAQRDDSESENQDFRLLVDTLHVFLVSWDLLDDNDKPLPNDLKTLKKTLGFDVLSFIIGKVFEDNAPKRKSRKPSTSRSQRKAN